MTSTDCIYLNSPIAPWIIRVREHPTLSMRLPLDKILLSPSLESSISLRTFLLHIWHSWIDHNSNIDSNINIYLFIYLILHRCNLRLGAPAGLRPVANFRMYEADWDRICHRVCELDSTETRFLSYSRFHWQCYADYLLSKAFEYLIRVRHVPYFS